MESSESTTPEANSVEGAGITIKLDAFEGPLDLLLHLIKKEEVDIWNIPIARITEQYLEYLQIMKDLNINVAGEWLLMAATLIYIKSRMLLPPDPVADSQDEVQEDPRKELVYQLLEHQKFKNAAQMLYTREEVENSVWNRPPQDVIDDRKEVVAATLFDLVKAFHEIVERFESQRAMEMTQEEVSIEEKIEHIRRLLLVHNTMLFSTFFDEARSKRHLIVTFLALLELVRLREIWIYQKKAFDEIYITKGGSAAENT
ncbi:MAG TPA: segregation/condensation protein A [Acidobacteriota bacterium]|nr:segregation/condensation protein A [Acidobacteriota bacterium]